MDRRLPIAAPVVALLAGIASLVALPTHARATSEVVCTQDAAPASIAPRGFATFGTPLPDDAFPLEIALLRGSVPGELSLGQVEDALVRAIETWNDVACSRAELRYVGRRSFEASSDEDVVLVSFADPDIHPCFANRRYVGYFTPACSRGPRQRIFLDARESRLSVEPAPLEAILARSGTIRPSAIDIESVLAHELGHALRLGHTYEDRAATMTASYLVDGGQRTLSADDRYGLCSLYPAPDTTTCGSDADCGLGGSCRTFEGEISVCDEERAPTGGYCSLDLLICRDTCVFTSIDTATGYCAESCTSDAECPTDYACIVPEGDDAGVCQLRPPPADETSCAAAPTRSGAPGGAPLAALLAILWGWHRRRERSVV